MTAMFYFCATGKRGLGHVRRITNIARSLKHRAPEATLALVTNASPAGMTDEEAGLFADVAVVPRNAMADYLQGEGARAVVVDTAVLPGLHRLDARLALLLRETKACRLDRFRLEGDRKWDLVMLPNPSDHWQPCSAAVPARYIRALGWVYRRPAGATFPLSPLDRGVDEKNRPRLLIASGGGGSGNKWQSFRTDVSRLLSELQQCLETKAVVYQVLGPRAGEDARIDGVDEWIRPGPHLHAVFGQADLVISAAGYNSTLELACTDVPVLLVPVPMTYDDQAGRARRWAPLLGQYHESARCDENIRWMANILIRRERRSPVDLGPSGAGAASALLTEWLQ